MYLSPVKKAMGWTISNRHIVKPVNPQRLSVLENHQIGKLTNENDRPSEGAIAQAKKRAAVKHWTERRRPISDPQQLETPAVHIAPANLTPAPPTAETVSSPAPPDSPTDTIKQGAITNTTEKDCDAIANTEGVTSHYIRKCSCGKTIRNCRCDAPDKKVETIENGCPECNAKLVNGEQGPTTAEMPKTVENSIVSGIQTELPGQRIENKFVQSSKDGWVQLVPKGNHPHHSGVLQVVDDDALSSMLSNFNKQKEDPNFMGLLVDKDHESNTGSTEAIGWVTNLDKRDSGMWGKISWTDVGQQAIDGGRFRAISPVWNRADCRDLGDKKLQPRKIDRIGVTNDPNIKTGVPITKVV